MARVIYCGTRKNDLKRMIANKELAIATDDEYERFMQHFGRCGEIFDQGQPELSTIIKFITKYRCDVISIIEPPTSKLAGKELVWAIPRKNPNIGCIILPPGTSIDIFPFGGTL